MADIGSTLRETRIREKIDVSTVEDATKIRAKYIRALEHEEWRILPGPAYVKSFLRTYAEYLGLDAHMLVEQYRAQFERPEELEVPAFARNEPLGARVRPPGPPSRTAVITTLAVALLALLFVLGVTGGDDGGGDSSDGRQGSGERDRSSKAAPATGTRGQREERPAGGTENVALSVLAVRDVWVCLVDAKGNPRIEGRTITAGEREGPFHSKRFRITLGNGGGDLRIDGKRRDLPETAAPQGYAISSTGTRPLPERRRPTCAPGEQGAAPS